MAFVFVVHPGIQQRGLVGWQVTDNHCPEQAEKGECVWACPLTDTLPVSAGSLVEQGRDTQTQGEKESEGEILPLGRAR